MEQEKVLALQKANLEKLIQNMDAAIRNEMLKYDEAEFYIRLQSECFGLYPVVVKALSLLVADDKRREVFCSFAKGHKVERLAAFHNLTPKEAIQMFRSTVREIHQKINNGAFTAKESVNIRLMMERNQLRSQLRNYNELYKELELKCEIAYDKLEKLQATLIKKTEDEQSSINQQKQAIREEIRKELQAEIIPPKEMQAPTETQTTKTTAKGSSCITAFVQWVQWLRMVYHRL